MHFRDTPEMARFRAEVQHFLATELPAEFRDLGEEAPGLGAHFDLLKDWRKKLVAKRWIAPAWPIEYGGAGLGVLDQFVLNEEWAEARAPEGRVPLAGPTLIVHGTEEQKREHLGRILSGDVVWCQGFSEPEAGSDLAGLTTTAHRDGDDYVINGEKIWTSGAQYAHWMFMLARTDVDAPKHKGISYFLLDMKSPGLTITPIKTMAGNSMFNQVHFEDVRVPARNRVGEENQGWYVATTTLDYERSGIAWAVNQKHALNEMIDFIGRHQDDGLTTASHRTSLRAEIADRMVETAVAKGLAYRVISMQSRGRLPNYEASMVKLFGTELSGRVARTWMSALGLYGQINSARSARAPLRGRISKRYIFSTTLTVAGGTSEVQRNIIATRGLGLPRD